MNYAFFLAILLTGEDAEGNPYNYYQIQGQQVSQSLAVKVNEDSTGKDYIRIADIHLPQDFKTDEGYLGIDYADVFGLAESIQSTRWHKLMRVHANDPDITDPDVQSSWNIWYDEWVQNPAAIPEPELFAYPSAMFGEEIEPPAESGPQPAISPDHDIVEDWFFAAVPTQQGRGRPQYYRIGRQDIARKNVHIISSQGLVDIIRINTQQIDDPLDAATDERFLGRNYYDSIGRGISGLSSDPNSWKWVVGVQYMENQELVEVRYDAWELIDPLPVPERFTYYVESNPA